MHLGQIEVIHSSQRMYSKEHVYEAIKVAQHEQQYGTMFARNCIGDLGWSFEQHKWFGGSKLIASRIFNSGFFLKVMIFFDPKYPTLVSRFTN